MTCVRVGPAERLPWPDAEFDRVLTQRPAVPRLGEFWESLLGAAGNMGAFVSTLDPARLERFRESCREELGVPQARFTLRARAWAVRGTP